jgi:hypothetical protein
MERRYSVIKSHRGRDLKVWEKVVATDLSLEDARRKERELNDTERAAHPELSSWTRDLFFIQLEDADKHHAICQARRDEICREAMEADAKRNNARR